MTLYIAGIILGMILTNERWHYIVMLSLIGWYHTKNGPHINEILIFDQMTLYISGIILGMSLTNERWLYIVTSSLIGWHHAQNGPHIDEILIDITALPVDYA